MRIAESDWKTFKRARLVALERFSQRVLDDCQRICCDESLSAHARYGELYQLLHDRDREMSSAFDDFRRSTAALDLSPQSRMFTSPADYVREPLHIADQDLASAKLDCRIRASTRIDLSRPVLRIFG
jgi:hypothetical protein